jgi:hypothetical protein
MIDLREAKPKTRSDDWHERKQLKPKTRSDDRLERKQPRPMMALSSQRNGRKGRKKGQRNGRTLTSAKKGQRNGRVLMKNNAKKRAA